MSSDLNTSAGADSRLRIVDSTATATLVIIGELDGVESRNLYGAVAAAVHRHPGQAVNIDASGLTFLDSGGVRGLLRCRDHAASAGSDLIVLDVSLIAYQVLQITGLLETFGITESSVRTV